LPKVLSQLGSYQEGFIFNFIKIFTGFLKRI